MKFLGYRRANGKVGTRNYVGVFSTVVCANEVARAIADKVDGAVAFSHQQGCCQTPIDLQRVTETLSGLGCNPNLSSVLLVGLGCEGTKMPEVKEAIEASGKRVECIFIQEEGGAAKTTAKGMLHAQNMAVEASRIRPEECGTADLVLGIKCGSSDTTSGLVTNPALGVTVEQLVKEDATVVIGEVTEFIGAEHILAAQAKDEQTGQKILDLVDRSLI